MTEVFSEAWMREYARLWNAERAMVRELTRQRFSAVVGYGFLDAETPRGLLVVARGVAEHAGRYDGRELDWDLRATSADWTQWLGQGFSLPKLLVAAGANRLQVWKGDHKRILRKPPLVSALLRAFALMTEVRIDDRQWTDAAMQDTLLDFWFGPLTGPDAYNRDRHDLWFQNGRAHDGVIRERFGALWEQAVAGELDGWTATPRGRLALILLLDQLSRHIHRGAAAAFAQDHRARALTREGMAQGHDRELFPIQRLFFYLPLEHAEDLAAQEQSVAAFAQLRAEAPATIQEDCEGFLDYARRHRDVIARFGRFPDLNAILSRSSTPEEMAFLKEPGSSFL